MNDDSPYSFDFDAMDKWLSEYMLPLKEMDDDEKVTMTKEELATLTSVLTHSAVLYSLHGELLLARNEVLDGLQRLEELRIERGEATK